ncbi:MAG: toll/interleukin-1 receptor domain-containing protein [Elainellaceae cyanobacterium]
MTKLFVSYSHNDEKFVRKLHAKLVESGQSIWVDWENITNQDTWLNQIKIGIEETDKCIIVISPDSIQSLHCIQEINYTIIQKKPVIFISQENIDYVHPTLNPQEWILFRDIDDFEIAFQRLMQVIYKG